MITLFDTHAHLAMLEHAPLQVVLERAKAAGIETMVSVSVDEASWQLNQDLAEKLPHVYYSVGLHPHEAQHWGTLKEKIESFIDKSPVRAKCVAIGEMGLDFYYNKSPREAQIQAFKDQLALAKKKNLPIIIHCRDSFTELYDLLRTEGMPPKGGVMHCFTGNETQAKEALDLGLYISFSGIVTFKNAKPLQEAAKMVPADRIVIETDCPFLAPVPHRGSPNEPAYLLETLKCVSSLRGLLPGELAPLVLENSKRLFSL